jgi:hypothetical protein
MSLDDRANLAAQMATRVGFYLHGAALASDRAEKRRLLVRGFHCWAVACRHIKAVEEVAPNAFAEGYAEASKIQDLIEGRAA